MGDISELYTSFKQSSIIEFIILYKIQTYFKNAYYMLGVLVPGETLVSLHALTARKAFLEASCVLHIVKQLKS